jgi:hypothetical protein
MLINSDVHGSIENLEIRTRYFWVVSDNFRHIVVATPPNNTKINHRVMV